MIAIVHHFLIMVTVPKTVHVLPFPFTMRRAQAKPDRLDPPTLCPHPMGQTKPAVLEQWVSLVWIALGVGFNQHVFIYMNSTYCRLMS